MIRTLSSFECPSKTVQDLGAFHSRMMLSEDEIYAKPCECNPRWTPTGDDVGRRRGHGNWLLQPVGSKVGRFRTYAQADPDWFFGSLSKSGN